MLKFIWGRGQGPTAERVKLQKELFNFSKNITYGFPSKPTCMGWDPELRLLAVGTKGGQVKVFGQPGVEIIGHLDKEEVGVVGMVWIPGQGRLVTHTSDNSLQLWQIDGGTITLVHTALLEGRLKTISSLCLEKEKKRLLVGTEGGNIYQLVLHSFTFDDDIIYQDLLMRNVPDNYKLNPGAVEALVEHPTLPRVLVVGYTRGLVLVWDRNTQSTTNTLISQQQLESLCWMGGSVSNLVTCHNDGSYVVWDTSNGEQVEPPNTPYGPYPCKAVSKIYSRGEEEGVQGTWCVFSGGMPRASYGDKFTVSVMRNVEDEELHTVFDLTSKIIDWVVVEQENGTPDSLLVLSEEELVCVDIGTSGWPAVPSPYMQSIHSSAITAISQVNNVTKELVEKLEGLKGSESVDERWPVTGGTYSGGKGDTTVIITGHEDGSVKFWLSKDNVLTHLTTFETNKYFRGEDDDDDGDRESDDEEEEWPPFRKVGQFDPYSDDPRLAVKKVMFCGSTGILIIGGTAGQVIAATVGDQEESATIVCRADTVTEKEGFTWKGHKPLDIKTGAIKQPAGFQPKCVLQITPPASITSLSLSHGWGILAAGTAHGVVVLDYMFQHVVTARSTLSAQDIANADDNPMSRKKSLKKSLRESFRKLRKGRSQRIVKGKGDVVEQQPRVESPIARPVERQVEARGGSEDGLGSMVRCLHFASTYIANSVNMSPTLWAGTNTGQVLVFMLTITPTDKRKNDKITAVLAKEIQLKHRAPVIDIEVHDAGGLPVSGPHPAYPPPHRVLITSEEQFKLFLLPQLKPCGKYKLTAHEGVRVRKTKSATFTSSKDAQYTENCLVYLANSGEVGVLSLPDLRRQVSTQVIRREDVVGISSLTFSNTGNGLYLSSSSELQQMSLSARNMVGAGGGRVELDRRDENREGGDTDSQADRQNQQNEREAVRNGGKSSPRGEADGEHNETTVSEVSGDITLDSIRDHMGSREGGGTPDMVVSSVETSVVERDLGGGRMGQERVEVVSRTVETIEVTTSSSIVQGVVAGSVVTNGVDTEESMVVTA